MTASLLFSWVGKMAIPKGLMYANEHNFAPRFGLAKTLPNQDLVIHGFLRHLLHARGSKYLVQSTAQRPVRVSRNAAGGQLHAASGTVHQRNEFRHAGSGTGRATGNDGQLHRIRSLFARAVCTAVECLRAKKFGREHNASKLVTSARAASICSART